MQIPHHQKLKSDTEMNIPLEICLKRRGQLAKLQDQRNTLEHDADEALLIIGMKADPLFAAGNNIHKLDTSAILRAAERLHDTVRFIKDVDKQINFINEDLHG
jgi:hypothetical protein